MASSRICSSASALVEVSRGVFSTASARGRESGRQAPACSSQAVGSPISATTRVARLLSPPSPMLASLVNDEVGRLRPACPAPFAPGCRPPRAKPTRTDFRLLDPLRTDIRQDVRVANELEAQAACPFFDFLCGALHGTIVGDRGRHDHDVKSIEARHHGLVHLAVRSAQQRPLRRRAGKSPRGPLTRVTFCATPERLRCNRAPHAPPRSTGCPGSAPGRGLRGWGRR